MTEDPFSPGFHRFKHISRHFEETGEWLWEGYFTKPDGRLDLRRPVPKEPMSWLISAFAVSRDKGLGITRRPTRVRDSLSSLRSAFVVRTRYHAQDSQIVFMAL